MKHDTFWHEEVNRLIDLDEQVADLSAFGRNLNLAFLKGRTTEVYDRDGVITDISKILLRRNKANVLLTGAAGCGKTAIVEGFAAIIAQKAVKFHRENSENFVAENISPLGNSVIYELSMNSLLSGAKYRGEFEEKLDKVLQICRQYPEIILFIDEIHQLNSIGQAEGSTSMGQIMKPALARGDIRVIGATTTEESTIIKKDKALARRFTELAIPTLEGESAVHCAQKILKDYSRFHNISAKEIQVQELLKEIEKKMPRSVFPNNIIDIIDESMASAKFEGQTSVNMADMQEIINRSMKLR